MRSVTVHLKCKTVYSTLHIRDALLVYSQYLVNFTLSYTLFSVPEKCKNPHGDDSGLYYVTPHLIKRVALNEAKLQCILLPVRLIPA
jgi:hypothetical protein